MGCNESKLDDTPLVIRCRERKQFIKAAADHRYALAAAHLSYFRSLNQVGDSLRKFVDEELILASSSSVSAASSVSSPAITLPSLDEHEDEKSSNNHSHNQKKNQKHNHSEAQHLHSHLDLSSDSEETHSDGGDDDDDDDDDDESHHQHVNVSREGQTGNISPFAHRDGNYWSDPNININITQPNGYPYGMNNQQLPPEPTNQGFWGGGGYYGMNPASQGWGMEYNTGNMNMNMNMNMNLNMNPNTNVYYMKKQSTVMRTVVQEPERAVPNGYSTVYWNNPMEQNVEGGGGGFFGYGAASGGGEMGNGNQNQGGYSGYPPMGGGGGGGGGGFFGFPTGGSRSGGERGNGEEKLNAPVMPPPPPSPKDSVWDFINPFEATESGYQGYYSQVGYQYGSVVSSPDSDVVREREGIPELEEETESELYKEEPKSRKTSKQNSGSGSRGVPSQHSEAGSRKGSVKAATKSTPSQKSDGSSRGIASHVSSEGSSKPIKEVETRIAHSSGEDSHLHSFSLSSEGEDVENGSDSFHNQTEEKSSSDPTVIKSMDEGSVKKKGVTFDIDDMSKQDFNSSKLSTLTDLSVHGTRDLREVVAEIRDDFGIASNNGKEVALMLEVGRLPYQPSFIKVLLSRIMHMVAPSSSAAYIRSMESLNLASKTLKLSKSYFADIGEEMATKQYKLSSTLDELYAWEKKLYKEVKEEERLRVIYEKRCKRLKHLDERGAEATKIDVVQASIRNLLTKLSMSIKAIKSISNRIHKLRDEELQPQVAELIHGLIRMWKSMLKCHQKQFQAVMESKIRSLKANTGGLQSDSSVRATIELKNELLSWCERFNDWINTQKKYVESMNSWLLRCLDYKAEVTDDGTVPFSPGRLGAPPIFVISNDWSQAMKDISEARVADAMHNFASILGQLWEKQDEEHRQRVRAEFISKDFKERVSKLQVEHDPRVPINNGNDFKMDLDDMRKRLGEERAKHKDAVKIVHDAASISIQGGLVPIFRALENFTSEALKAHEQVRLQRNDE